MNLQAELSEKTSVFDLKVWEVIGISVGLFIVIILFVLSLCVTSRKKSKKGNEKLPISQIPNESKEIKEVRMDQISNNNSVPHDGIIRALQDKFNDKESDNEMVYYSAEKTKNGDNIIQSGSFTNVDKDNLESHNSHPITAPSPLLGLPEFSHLGWGHWFTLRDLEIATNRFSKENIIGEGGYGVVYQGHLINGSPVAVKKLLNNL